MRFRLNAVLILITIACGTARPALAWSNKEHIELTRLAIEGLIADPQTPRAMKDWLKAAGGFQLTPETLFAVLL